MMVATFSSSKITGTRISKGSATLTSGVGRSYVRSVPRQHRELSEGRVATSTGVIQRRLPEGPLREMPHENRVHSHRYELVNVPSASLGMSRSFQNIDALKFHPEFFEEFLQIPDMLYCHVHMPAFIL